MEIGKTLYVVNGEGFRQWLSGHHDQEAEIWLIIYRKGAGKLGMSYNDAIEEAICFGWVDSVQKSMDTERYAIRFTPRRKKSHWSASNKALALKMLRAGKMTPAGRAVLPDEVLRLWNEEQGEHHWDPTQSRQMCKREDRRV